jgi:LuxR family maltose regulon positive regulatory protein
MYLLPSIAAVQVLVLLRQGDLDSAETVAQQYDLPLSRARVHLANNESAAAVPILDALRQEMASRGWQDELLKITTLESIALDTSGASDEAIQSLRTALKMAEPDGFIRNFIDEGQPMAQLLQRMKAQGGRQNEYIGRLLDAFDLHPSSLLLSPLVEPLSQRELEILQLVAQGLSNKEISNRLFLALSTVKGHNRNIYGKLQVQRRTEAVARARELGLI